MSLDTDFSQTPYYDDFDENKNFHRVLFKPGVAVQARELTQLQTILQNQVERFGNNILKEGTIVQGCNFTEITNLAYVKIFDLNTNGQPIVLSQYTNPEYTLQGADTGVKAKILAFSNGLESQDPDLNTLYFKYISSGTSNSEIKTFNPTENLNIISSTNTIIDTVTAAGSVLDTPATAVGRSYGVRVGDGIIYQKGFFTRVDDQLIVVSKYTDIPDGLVVGFVTQESIIDSNADTSLLDNANGFNNYQAPGADRLKLTPILTVKTLAEAQFDSTFFAIQEYNSGNVVRRNNDTQYNKILDVIEKRTKDESGNYIVNQFSVNVSNNVSNTELLSFNIGPGLAYVEGKRVELIDNYRLDLPKANTVQTETSQNISTNYGNYILVKEFMGRFDTHLGANIDLFDTTQTNVTDGSIPASANGVSIGTAKATAIVYDSGTPGSNSAVYKVYLSDIRISNTSNSWANVKSLVYSSNVGTADLVSTTIYEQSFKRRIYKVGKDAIASLPAANTSAYYTFRSVNNSITMASNGYMSFTLPSGEWPYSVGSLTSDQKKDLILVSGATSSPYVANKIIDLSSATVTVTNTTNITINVASPSGSISNCILYYNAKKDAITAPATKTLKTVYIKIACNTAGTTGPYSLGLPDVYSIDNIWVGNTTYQESNTAADYKASFNLNTGQKDDYYGLSSIVKKNSLTLTNTSTLLVKAKVFEPSSTSSFFTVKSYPIDDANTANTAAIQTYQIPKYSGEDGTIYPLRDCVDFRIYAVNTAAYATTSGTATVNPSSNVSFNRSQDLLLAAPNKELVSDYSYYLARKDLAMVNEFGDFVIKSGVASENPIPPSDPSIGMVIADISIPPYPSLPSSVASKAKVPEYGVKLTTRNNQRFTMKDIGDISNRVERLEYYTALNLLEVDTKDLIISDSNGANRFKNGILVDNFSNLLGADVDNVDYSAGYDLDTNEVIPFFREYNLNLKLDSGSSNTYTFGKYNVTLAKLNTSSNRTLLNQPYATSVRSLAADVWSFKGQMEIYPEYDGGRDTVITAEPQEAVVPRYTYSSGIAVKAGANVAGQISGSTNLDRSYMRPQNIRIQATGLRPNTRHYFAFDGQKVSEFCSPGAKLTGNNEVAAIYSKAPRGTPVYTDNNGELLAVFELLNEKYYVGERILQIADIDDFTTVDSYISSASTSYISYNIPVPVAVSASRSGRGLGFFGAFLAAFSIFDPIAQTFKVDINAGKDSVVVLNKIDLYFKQKSSNSGRGITVQIRETENGYPSSIKTVQNSIVRLKNSDINVSNKATIPTTITFNDPVLLKTNAEYSIVLVPDQSDPDFYVYTSKLGQIDLIENTQVVQDKFDGVLFTSSNGRSWTPYQSENLKFTLYTSTFAKSGIQNFTNDDHEFFTITPISGTFSGNETVIKINANATGTASISTATNVITTTADLTSVFAPGDRLGYWANNIIVDVLRVSSANSTTITLSNTPRYSNTAANIFKTIFGNISYNNNVENILHISSSSASSGGSQNYFASGDTIRGVQSQASATIASVDNLKMSMINAKINESNFTYTDTKYNIQIAVDSDGTNRYSGTPLKVNGDIPLNKTAAVIMSRSNEIVNNITQSFRIGATLTNTRSEAPYDSSPVINYGSSTINVFEYVINNNSTDETKPTGGNAKSKFISKVTTLAENLDAEDLKLIITGYRPTNTNIEVYIRFKNKNDQRPFDTIEWTKLGLKDSSNIFSSTANLFDYKEFEYYIPSVTGVGSLNNGEGAALNDGILTYKDLNGIVYTGYKYFAVKIVMLASNYSNVPKLKNYRAIALT